MCSPLCLDGGYVGAAGATTVAVLPICMTQQSSASADTSQAESNQAAAAPLEQQQQQQHSHIFDLPIPLELVALCMLRVMQRGSHEGGLDANTKSAMSE